MNMFEEARALSGMIEMCALTQNEIAKKLGVSQSYVANKLRLLRFSDEIQKRITRLSLSERHARALLKLECDDEINLAIEKIQSMRLNVRESEIMIDNMKREKSFEKIASKSIPETISNFESFLNESIKILTETGIRVKKIVDTWNNKRYITLLIEE